MRNKLLCLIVFFVQLGYAQILDDTTKAIYGTHSTNFYYEEAVVFNDSSRQQLDTTLDYHHLYNFTYTDGVPYQDLGALGSPQQEIFPVASKITGVQLGMNTTNRFAYQNDEVRYFDTKSPYSELTYYQNFNKQEYFDAQFSRSATENFNVGFRLTRIGSDNQIGGGGVDNQYVDAYAATMFTSLRALKNHYRLLANFRYYDYQLFESGGAFDDGGTIARESLFFDFVQTNLSNVSSQDRRANYHLYHHLSIDSAGSLQLFHTFDRERRRNIYTSTDQNVNRLELSGLSYNDFFPTVNFDSTGVNDSTSFTVYENKLGLKGTFLDFFYMGYVRYRDYSYKRNIDSSEFLLKEGKEVYVGGALQRSLWKNASLKIRGEVSPEGYVVAQNSLKSSFLDLNFNYVVAPPSALVDSTYNNHFGWSTNFSNMTQLEFKAKAKYRYQSLKAEVYGSYLLDKDYIYFNQAALPTQYDGVISTTKLGVKVQTNLGKFYAIEHALFGATSNEAIVRIPSYFNHLQLSFRTRPRAKHYLLMLGIDLYSRGKYYADAYMPYIQQFYLQDEFELQAYTWADVFVSIKVKNARIFLKIPQVTQGLFGPGYFVSPYYYGQRRVVELGFNWRFFD